MFKQYELPYSYSDFKGCIDQVTAETHHGRHHAAYTDNLNSLAEKAGLADMDITELLASLDSIGDPQIRTGIRNNGGGFYNHNLYFEELSPDGGGQPSGELAEKIDAAFGSFEAFRDQISALAVSQFGSGWAWLSVTPSGELVLSASANQDNPISLGTGNTPIFTIDVWEHAYYLRYKNLRAAYVKDLFDMVDWSVVERKYQEAKK